MGQNGPSPGLWNCFFYDVNPSWTDGRSSVLEPFGDVAAWLPGGGRRGWPAVVDRPGWLSGCADRRVLLLGADEQPGGGDEQEVRVGDPGVAELPPGPGCGLGSGPAGGRGGVQVLAAHRRAQPGPGAGQHL